MRATTPGRSRSSAPSRTWRAGEVAILELIASGEVRLVVNTPTPRSGAVRDAAEIRLAATAEGILCLTAIETAVAAAEALEPGDRAPAVGGPLAGRVGSEPGRPGRTGRPRSRADRSGRVSGGPGAVRPRHLRLRRRARRQRAAVDPPRRGAARHARLADDRGRDRRALRRPDRRGDARQRSRSTSGATCRSEWAAFGRALLAAFAAELEPVDGVADAVDAIQAAGYATCVASSGGHGKIRRNLAKTGLLDRFGDRMFSGDDVVHGKPAPDLFLHAAAAMGVRAGPGAPSSRTAVTGSKPRGRPGCRVFAYTARCDAGRCATWPASADHAVRRHAVAARMLIEAVDAAAPDAPRLQPAPRPRAPGRATRASASSGRP